MKRIISVVSFLFLLAAASVFAKGKEPKEYLTGKLVDMGMQNVQVGSVGNANIIGQSNASIFSTPIMRDLYGFQISYDGISYFTTYSKGKLSKSPDVNWIVGDPIEFREDGKKVFLKRSDGKELKTKLIKKVRE